MRGDIDGFELRSSPLLPNAHALDVDDLELLGLDFVFTQIIHAELGNGSKALQLRGSQEVTFRQSLNQIDLSIQGAVQQSQDAAHRVNRVGCPTLATKAIQIQRYLMHRQPKRPLKNRDALTIPEPHPPSYIPTTSTHKFPPSLIEEKLPRRRCGRCG